MGINLSTVIVVLFLIMITQIIALFLQNRVNKKYPGISYWLVGCVLLALGFIMLPMINIDHLKDIVKLASPLIVLGHVLLLIGVKKFFNRNINMWLPTSIFFISTLLYYYFMYINVDIVLRTHTINTSVIIISLLIAYELLFKKEKYLSSTANFTAIVFLLYGLAHAVRIFQIHQVDSITSYNDPNFYMVVVFFVSIVISNLWTFGLILMINQRLNHDNQTEKEKMQFIFNTNLDAQSITRLDNGFIVDINDEFTVLTGYSKAEAIGKSMRDSSFWTDPDDRQIFAEQLSKNDVRKNMEFIFQRKDESRFLGMISAKIILIESVPHIVSVIRDITERKKSENAIIESEEKYRSILNASPDDITITDLDGYILMNSPAAKEMFGYEADFDQFLGMQLLDFIVAEDVERAKSNIISMHQGNERNTNEYRGVRKDRSIIDIEVNSGIIYNAHGQADKLVFIIRDISQRKLIESQMKELIVQLEKEKDTAQLNSVTDSLTGLYNRGYFDKTLWAEFSTLAQSGLPLSLIMLDIDNFKKYNDSYGHPAGDRCIQMISTTLMNIVEGTPDTAARYGGEEFIIVLPGTEEERAMAIGERIRKEIEDLAIAHISSTTAKHVTVSVGIVTVYPAEYASPDDALKLVDNSLYTAKNNGRNCCVFNAETNVLHIPL